MAVSQTCTKVTKRGGRVYVRFADKTELEFDSLDQAKEYVRRYSTDAAEFLRAMLIAKFLHVSPDGSNPSLLESKVITLDLDMAQNLVRVTNG